MITNNVTNFFSCQSFTSACRLLAIKARENGRKKLLTSSEQKIA